jgi:hypothetical protein
MRLRSRLVLTLSCGMLALACLTNPLIADVASRPEAAGASTPTSRLAPAQPVSVANAHYTLSLDGRTGALVSFRNQQREFIHASNAKQPLVRLRFRNDRGQPLELSSLDAREVVVTKETAAAPDAAMALRVDFRSLGGRPVHVSVRVSCPEGESLSHWSVSVEHDLDEYLDWIEFPAVTVPNDLASMGGDGRLFWPAMEGVVVDDVAYREKGWCRYHPIEFPNRGWEGFYPGPCQMQFMAYYSQAGGLYMAAHDAGGFPKGIEFHPRDGGIALEYRVYPGAIRRGKYTLPYDMVLGVFDGDWHDAADIYRRWVAGSGLPLPPKLGDNKALPEWIHDSPVVVTYPVRGTRDLGDMSPNEYYPYTKALPQLRRLAKEFDSRVLTLLMHWEGSAPWAPPYVWPPFGDLADFRAFGDELHAGGHLLGLYCSGIAWTQKSNLWDYNREAQFEREHLKDIMVAAPNGEVPWSPICSGPNAQRWSYDMCPANAFVGKVVAGEAASMAKGGADYIQYFDQDLGGTSYFCYAKNHGHPPAPGPWMKTAMGDVQKKGLEAATSSGRPVVIGCEAAAAEPYLSNLLFNDARFNINLMVGTPVPAYAYVYHEYVNNFMGNQNGTMTIIDADKSPHSFFQRLTYGFVAGDMLTVTLKGNGQMHWDWGTDWSVPAPDQARAATLIRNLNAWRRGAGKPFLHLGRMGKPLPLEGVRDVPMVLRQGGTLLHWPSLMTSRWTSPDGRQAQIVANYLPEPQTFSMRYDSTQAASHAPKRTTGVRVYDVPTAKQGTPAALHDGVAELKVAPLSAVMVEWE